MQQLSLAAPELTPWDALLGRIETAVHYLGVKEVTWRLNSNKSTVSDALKDRNERYWRQEWTVTVLEMLRDQRNDTATQLAHSILSSLAVVTKRFEVVDGDDEPTAEELEIHDRVSAKIKKRKKAA